MPETPSTLEKKENMTKVQPRKPLIRETDALYKKRPIILEVHSGYLAFRVTWHPIRYALSIEGAFFAAPRPTQSARFDNYASCRSNGQRRVQ